LRRKRDVLISFIIPAHNEEQLLGRTLDALLASARALGEPFEVIVVDDDSTDATAEVARSRGAGVVSVKLRKISAVRNAGAWQAQGDVFIFVDADTLLPEATLRGAVQALRDGAIGGGARLQFDSRAPLLLTLLVRAFAFLWAASGWATGCFVFVRRDAFHAVGGFDERYFAGEELTISRALKRRGRFVILPTAVVTSARKLQGYTTWEVVRQSMRIILKGPRAREQRDGLEMWYDDREREGKPR
jgi:glycosyltransferase involved in cell wall biosynthesis